MGGEGISGECGLRDSWCEREVVTVRERQKKIAWNRIKCMCERSAVLSFCLCNIILLKFKSVLYSWKWHTHAHRGFPRVPRVRDGPRKNQPAGQVCIFVFVCVWERELVCVCGCVCVCNFFYLLLRGVGHMLVSRYLQILRRFLLSDSLLFRNSCFITMTAAKSR